MPTACSPTLAAVAIRLFGLPGCFLANGLSYVAIVAALSRVKFERAGGAKAFVEENETVFDESATVDASVESEPNAAGQNGDLI